MYCTKNLQYFPPSPRTHYEFLVSVVRETEISFLHAIGRAEVLDGNILLSLAHDALEFLGREANKEIVDLFIHSSFTLART